MSAAAFAYAFVLSAGGDKEKLLALLPQERRSAVANVLDDWKDKSPEQIRQHFVSSREREAKTRYKALSMQLGKPVNRVLPRLRAWLARPF
jgi:hypothetical protein